MSLGIIFLLLLALGVIIGWHLFFPLLVGGIVAITAAAWGILVASVVIFCVAILLVFIFTGIGAFILGIFAFIWMVLAIIFFPILFPILFPLFILFLVVSYFLRRKKRMEKEKAQINQQNKPPLP